MAVKNPTALLVAVAATLLVACEGQSFTADVSTTSTVTVGNATVLILAAPLVVEVEANPLRRDVFLELTGVVTASTASRAASLAEGLELVVTRPNERTMRVDVGGWRTPSSRACCARWCRRCWIWRWSRPVRA
jgi:hypothetical protein